MGAHVRFIAFRNPPDVAKLAAIPGLSGYRLFKHASRPEWYLEGPNPEGDDITFNEPLDYAPKGETSRRAQAGVKSFADAIKRAGVKSWGQANDELIVGLAISAELGIPTLLVYGNDSAGVDVGFICNDGEVIFAKLPALPKGLAVFENGAARVEAPFSEEFEEGEPVLDLHQFATEVANKFFDTSIRWRVTSDPFEYKAEDFALITQSGERALPRLPGDDTKKALWTIESSDAAPAEKLRKCIAAMDPHVSAALEPGLISAPRALVDYMSMQVLACTVHVGAREWDNKSYEPLAEYFGELSYYLRLLKPKPDFRQNIDFAAEGRRLLANWRALKARL